MQELNAEVLQLRVLDQLRLVAANQKAVVWISSSMPIIFTPKQTGLLVNQSRIVVKIDAFNNMHASIRKPSLPEQKNIKFKNIGLINDGLLRPYLHVPERKILRALPIDSDGKRNLIHPYIVFVHEDLLEKYKDFSGILGTMKNIPSKVLEKLYNCESIPSKIEDLCVEIVPVNCVVFRSLCREVYNKNIPTILISKSLNAIINVENGSRIILTIIGDKIEQPEHVDIVTYSEKIQSEIDVIEKFKNCVIESTHSGKKFLINDSMIKQNTEISQGFIQFKLKPEKLMYTMLNSESFRHCTISAKCLTDADLELPRPRRTNLEYDNKNYCRTMKSTESLVEKILLHLYFEIHREANFKGASEIKSNVLVCGKCNFIHFKIKSIQNSALSAYTYITNHIFVKPP